MLQIYDAVRFLVVLISYVKKSLEGILQDDVYTSKAFLNISPKC